MSAGNQHYRHLIWTSLNLLQATLTAAWATNSFHLMNDSSPIIPDKDMTGRDRLVWNVLTGWGSYLVFFVAGFVMPRMIDEYIGQVSLGIWDFCWSFINYISLSNLGVGASTNRFVAVHRAANETDELCRIVSSVVVIQLAITLFVLLATAIVVWALPVYFSEKLGAELSTAQWVVGLLGAGLAFEMLANSSRGVITGCHRWDVNNGINAASRMLIVVVMLLSLVLGGGLVSLALIYLVVTVLAEMLRMVVAQKTCPEIKVRWSFVSYEHGLKAFKFGGKAIVGSLPPIILVQSASIILMATLGPAALAIFARPIALVRHVSVFIDKFATVLTPTVGSLQQLGHKEELRQFMLTSTRFGVAFTLPFILLLVIYGDVILELWMGKDYAHWSLIALLAAGYFLPVSQNSVYKVLMGMDLHGRVSLLVLVVGLILFALIAIVIDMTNWSLLKVGVLVAVPLTIGNGIILPLYACNKLNIPVLQYLKEVFLLPMLLGSVFALILVLSRFLFSNDLIEAIIVGSFLGTLVLAILYWYFLIPERYRGRIMRYWGRYGA